jgi:DNA-binding transcriptional LysR family regulator
MATDSRRLSFLLAVYRAGGILAAGDLLGITPSAVSQQIARLEAEEGFAVLERTPRGVILTPAGRVLVDAAERIETELVGARQAIAALGDSPTGTVKLGAFQTAIRWIVAPALAPLANLYPGLNTDILDGDPAEATAALRTGELDLIIGERDAEVEQSTPRGIAELPLLDEPWRVIVPNGTPLPGRLSDLAGLTFVSGVEGTAADRAVKRLARSLGSTIATRHTTYDFATALTLVEAGEGAALLPALALLGPENKDKVQVASMPGLGARRLYVRHRSNRREPTRAVKAVVDELVRAASNIAL